MKPFAPWLALCLLAAPLACGQEEGYREVNPEVKTAVERALRYLAQTQAPTGGWSDAQPAVVGLAIMTFLAHGDVPGRTPYPGVVEKGVKFLLAQQNPNGQIGNTMYNHGFATLALAESYGVVEVEGLAAGLKNAVDLIINAQNGLGGWRYSPGASDADSTVSGCQLMALRAAAEAGIEVREEVIARAVKYIKRCTDRSGTGYSSRGNGNTPRSSIALTVLSLCGEHESQEAEWAASFVAARPHDHGTYMYYGLYYSAQGMFQVGGDKWVDWNNRNIELLLPLQQPSGAWSDRIMGTTGGTATAALSLLVNWKLLPIYQR